jgi:hypothetical protein
MRIAVLILAILACVVSLGVGACATVCAGCEGGVGTVCTSAVAGGDSPGGSVLFPDAPNQDDLTASYRKLFWGNVILGVGMLLQAALILTGGIVAFSKLGKGEPGKTGAILMAIGLGLSILTAIVAIIIVSQAGDAMTFNTEDILFSFFMKATVGNTLAIVATVLAFIAKPEPVLVKEVVYVTTQPPGSV